MPGEKPSRALVLEREERAWELSVDGHSTREIGRRLAVSHTAVEKILRRVAKRLAKDFQARVERHTEKQLARLEKVIAEGFDAWEASTEPAKKSRKKTTSVPILKGGADDTSKRVSTIDRVEELKEAITSPGDAAFLRVVVEAVGQENKLLGLDAPKKIDILDKRRPLEKLTDEELRQRIAADQAELAGMSEGE